MPILKILKGVLFLTQNESAVLQFILKLKQPASSRTFLSWIKLFVHRVYWTRQNIQKLFFKVRVALKQKMGIGLKEF